MNVKAQSLKVFMNEYDTSLAIRYSLLNIAMDSRRMNIPLYLIWNTENYLKISK